MVALILCVAVYLSFGLKDSIVIICSTSEARLSTQPQSYISQDCSLTEFI